VNTVARGDPPDDASRATETPFDAELTYCGTRTAADADARPAEAPVDPALGFEKTIENVGVTAEDCDVEPPPFPGGNVDPPPPVAEPPPPPLHPATTIASDIASPEKPIDLRTIPTPLIASDSVR
jgi:hypothetical protein